MEKPSPPTRGAFQPTRGRFLQPSQLFKPTRSTNPSDQPNPQPNNTQSHDQDPATEQTETKTISRIPRLPPPQSPTLAKPPSNPPKFATPFMPNKSQNPPVFAPLLSKSQKRPQLLPLRSANQPILKSKNQPALQTPNRPPPSSLPNNQLANPVSIPKPQPFEPRNPKTKTTTSQPVVSSSQQGQSSESRNSQQSHITLHNASSPAIPADVSVQQPAVPFPLSTLPTHVLQTMSQDKRDGFVAGWSAGWDAHAQCMRNRQNDPSTLSKSPAPSNVVSQDQNCSTATQDQSSLSLHPVRLSPPVGPRKDPPSGTRGTTKRRKLSDPYATEETGKNLMTVGANKRPRTSPPTNTNTRPSLNNPMPPASKSAPSPTQILNARSTPAAQPTPSSQEQSSNNESQKRMSGLNAYLARGRLNVMQSANAAFAAATTSELVELQRKKPKRGDSVKWLEPRRPNETRTRQESRRPVDIRPRHESRRPVEIRPRQEPRRAMEARTRQEPRRSVEARPRQDPRRPVEIRPRPLPIQAASMNLTAIKTKPPSWLKNAGRNDKEHVQIPADASTADPRQESNTPTAKNPIAISARTPKPTSTNKTIPVRQNSVERRKQSFSQDPSVNGSRCDLDMVRRCQESQEEEESGWGSALNAATTRERLPIRPPKAAELGKHPNTRSNAAEKPARSSTGVQRDPRRRELAESEANSSTNRLAEKERDDITVQAYAERFGLVIIERDRESGKVEWVACKFCPVFGCRTRDPDYIMAHRAPFSLKKFVTHLEKDHCVKWKEYKQANAEKKGQFFSGKVLPAKAYHDRVAELKRSQDGMARRRATPGVTAEEENAKIDKALENLAKCQADQSVSTLTVDTTDECWIGRDRFRDPTWNRSISVCQRLTQNRRTDKLPSLERISKCVKELEINSNIAGFILHGVVKDSMEEDWADNDRGFTDTIVLDGNEMRPTTLIFSSVDEATASRVAFALRYLHDGIAGSICMVLQRDTPQIQAGMPTSDATGREVLGHGNALMALGMQILTSALATDWRSWAIGLTTRSCRFVRGGAVEVLLSMHDDDGEIRKTHLITVKISMVPDQR